MTATGDQSSITFEAVSFYVYLTEQRSIPDISINSWFGTPEEVGYGHVIDVLGYTEKYSW